LSHDLPFVLAALDQAPDLIQEGIGKLLALRRIEHLPDDLPPDDEAAHLIKRLKEKRTQRRDSGVQLLRSFKRLCGELEELLDADPQSPEAMALVQLVQLKARTLPSLHAEALARDTEITRDEQDEGGP